MKMDTLIKQEKIPPFVKIDGHPAVSSEHQQIQETNYPRGTNLIWMAPELRGATSRLSGARPERKRLHGMRRIVGLRSSCPKQGFYEKCR